MKTMSLTDAQTQLAQLVDVLKEGPVLLLRKGQPCAALVGLDEHFDREAFSLGRDQNLRRLVDEACRDDHHAGRRSAVGGFKARPGRSLQPTGL